MNKVVLTIIGALLFVASGCNVGMSLGPQANKETCLNGSIGWSRASVTLPLVSVSAAVHKNKCAVKACTKEEK